MLLPAHAWPTWSPVTACICVCVVFVEVVEVLVLYNMWLHGRGPTMTGNCKFIACMAHLHVTRSSSRVRHACIRGEHEPHDADVNWGRRLAGRRPCLSVSPRCKGQRIPAALARCFSSCARNSGPSRRVALGLLGPAATVCGHGWCEGAGLLVHAPASPKSMLRATGAWHFRMED